MRRLPLQDFGLFFLDTHQCAKLQLPSTVCPTPTLDFNIADPVRVELSFSYTYHHLFGARLRFCNVDERFEH